MLLARPFILGFWIGLVILFVTFVKHLRKSINARGWLSYYIPYTRIHKTNYRRNKIDSILLWISVMFVMAGIFITLETHQSSDSQPHVNEGGTAHNVTSEGR
ncbi:MAG: hypothetical protein ACM3SR_12005 [Ignavibacteriales bacterium]